MKLRAYLKDKDVRAFAARSGVSHETIYKAMAGIAVSWPTAKALSEATGGQVDAVALADGDRESA